MAFTNTVLITGGTSGLGYYCALNIAKHFPDHLVVVASRTDLQSSAESINAQLGQTNTKFLALDLSSKTKIRLFVNEWESSRFPPIDTLVLNAGLQFVGPEVHKTADGIESTFGVNHVGHSLLFHLLIPQLATNSRIVVVASGTHDPAQKTMVPDAKYTTAEELAHPTAETEHNDGRQRYASSKLANVMWTYALHRRLTSLAPTKKKLTVTAFDPGLMPGTGLAREAGAGVRWIWMNVLPRLIPVLRLIKDNIHLPEESGASLAWLATSPDVHGVSGVYYEGRKEIKSSVASYDEAKQEDLWEWTLQNIAENPAELDRFQRLD